MIEHYKKYGKSVFIRDFLSGDTMMALRGLKSLISFAADKVGDLTGYAGEILTGTPRADIDKKVESSVDDFMQYAGYCISDVTVEALMDGVRESAMSTVSDFHFDDMVENGVDDLYNFAEDIGDFLIETHLPPTPCCYLISNICKKIKKM
ncbi:hypothetical protein [Candidatus Magnetomonas plexicatena]|uniref:hypothetical protein n=1 Tax=Candidatus Magnetomonas plexicatena TaxID=2552947 RepID=UPI0011031B04|nr:hypothetical protein E2O03_013990 [Nitrospirales bacterium LBB_01]